jgi:hypothetical protein
MKIIFFLFTFLFDIDRLALNVRVNFWHEKIILSSSALVCLVHFARWHLLHLHRQNQLNNILVSIYDIFYRFLDRFFFVIIFALIRSDTFAYVRGQHETQIF